MTIKLAINGFGRIGRLVFRIIHEFHEGIEVVAINDLVSPDNLAYLLKHDSVHRSPSFDVKAEGDSLIVGKTKTRVFSEKDPAQLPWKELGVDYVVESTGLFTKREGAIKHIEAGAKRVVISAPAKSEGIPTFVMGVNHKEYKPETDQIISNASCTTNCLAPLTKVIVDHFGLVEGLMTTVHSITASQPSVDGPSHKDFRGGRAASINIIPSSTGAAKAVGVCLPEVQGKLTGMAFRVPTTDVSVVDLTVRTEKETSLEEIGKVIAGQAKGEMKGVIHYTNEQVVSTDFVGSHYSCIYDQGASISLNNSFFKLIAWYDNEMGYSHRVVDLVKYMKTRE